MVVSLPRMYTLLPQLPPVPQGGEGVVLELGLTTPPMTVEEAEAALSAFSESGRVGGGGGGVVVVLRHGDIVNFGIHRYVNAFFVVEDEDGRRRWVGNPDLSGSGYLTVPLEVTSASASAARHHHGGVRGGGGDALATYGDIARRLGTALTAVFVPKNDRCILRDFSVRVREGSPSRISAASSAWSSATVAAEVREREEVDHGIVWLNTEPMSLELFTTKRYVFARPPTPPA